MEAKRIKAQMSPNLMYKLNVIFMRFKFQQKKIKTAVNILKDEEVAALTDVKNILESYNYNCGIRFINRLLEQNRKSRCRPNI